MYFIYTLILSLGLIVTCPYYLVRFRKYLPTLRDRLGFVELPQLKGSIWIHAVSVGEVKSVETLLERLRNQFPGKPVVISTATPAGQQLARDRHDIIDHAFYFPLDLPWCVKRTMARVDPELVIIAETEIWPNFLRACRHRQVRVVMINGRISDKSFARYRLIRPWLRQVFESYSIMGMQSETDRQRIQEIGADPQKVTVFGNLKYDVAPRSGAADSELARFLSEWNRVWMAASTMPGEEELIVSAYQQLTKVHPELKLVIAPRHPERFDPVAEILKRSGLNCLRRTELQNTPPHRGGVPEGRGGRSQTAAGLTTPSAPSAQTPLLLKEGSSFSSSSASILLLDSIGELAALFRYATVVFMGGSLVARGGHNILEPARHGKPVIFGPHMENFRDMARLFLDAKGAMQIKSAAELAPAVSDLLSNPGQAGRIGSNALAIVEQNAGATDRVLQVLEPIGATR